MAGEDARSVPHHHARSSDPLVHSLPEGTTVTVPPQPGPADPLDLGNLPKLVSELQKIEFKTSEDLLKYAKLTRQIGLELHMRMAMDADVIAAILGRYKGQWYTFGVQSKVRGKLVGAHLKLGAEAVKIFGLAGIKMYSSYLKHFVKPEIEAKAKGTRNKADGFTVSEAAKGAAGTAGGRGTL